MRRVIDGRNSKKKVKKKKNILPVDWIMRDESEGEPQVGFCAIFKSRNKDKVFGLSRCLQQVARG